MSKEPATSGSRNEAHAGGSSRPSVMWLLALAMALDAVALFTGFLAAHRFRFAGGIFPGPPESLRPEHWSTLALLLPVWIVIHGVNRLYQPRTFETLLDHAGGILKSITLGCLLVLALGFFTRTDYFFEKRLVLGFAWLFTLILSSTGRLGLLRWVYRRYYTGHRRLTRIVIVGAGAEGTRFSQRIGSSEVLEYHVVGFADDDPAKHGRDIAGVKVLGSVDELPEIVRAVSADQVFVAIPSLGQERTLAMMSRCMRAQVPVRLVSDLLHLLVSDTSVETIDGVPTFDIRGDNAPQLALFLKRAFDILVSGTLLLMFFPLFLFIGMLIKVFSPGPVLFKQVRAGQFAREFTMCKFRTMKLETDDSIHRDYAVNFITGQQLDFEDRKRNRDQVFKMTRDPRVTPVGSLLRRTSLDELPQLLNVWRGEMSIVGPRPPIFYELNHYKEWHKKRLRAKPGLTGLWQVSGRSTVPFDEMVLLDLYYIDHWSLKTDLEILFRTIPVVFSGEGAY